MKLLLCTIVSVLFINQSVAQKLSAGLGFGYLNRNVTGKNIVADSITIVADGGGEMNNVYSVFLEYQLNRNIQLRSSLNGTNHLVGFLMYNSQATCQFCNVVKAITVGSFNLNSANTIAIKLPFRSPIEFNVLAGVRINFNFTRDEPDISFDDGPGFPELTEVYNNLEKTIKPVYFNSVIGIKSEWWRFGLVLELDKNIGKSITSDLEFFGQKYTFLNKTNTFTLTLNYKIIPWKEKNKI